MKAKESKKITQRDEKALKDTLDIQLEDNRVENKKNQQQSSSYSRNKSRDFEKMSFEDLCNEFDIKLGSSVSSVSKTQHEDKTTG